MKVRFTKYPKFLVCFPFPILGSFTPVTKSLRDNLHPIYRVALGSFLTSKTSFATQKLMQYFLIKDLFEEFNILVYEVCCFSKDSQNNVLLCGKGMASESLKCLSNQEKKNE